ncbi:MAG: NADH-ubiquinone oxidoreductase [Rickettsiaceae bacterium H1]|nr:NADH-ubiquinone oxidoreductase [Rickettsiaceae bacterium H1]
MIGFIKRLLFKKLVAIDQFGNRYYQYNNIRQVKYKGRNEPTKIPPEYLLWLHYSIDKIENKTKHNWEKERIINLTGTNGAYLPDGHILKSPFQIEKKDYIPWEPGHE